MEIAETIFVLLGVTLLVLTGIDAFLTMFSQRGAGWFTNLWTNAVWKVFLSIHRRRPIHRILALVGPGMTVAAVIIWYALLLIGWSLIFLSGKNAVMVNSSGEDTDLLQRFYFTGTTLSGVGYGDLVPTDPPWTMLSNIAAFTTSFLVATSISYIIPVISAALQRRQIGENIHAVGESGLEIVKNSWTEGNSEMSDTYWAELFRNLSHHSHVHLVYPVLHFFHAPEERKASTLGILHLADALFLIENTKDSEHKPPPIFFRVARAAFLRFAEVKGRQGPENIEERNVSLEGLSAESIREIGLEPVAEEDFQQAIEDYRSLRRRLVALCESDGWREAV